MDKSEKLRSPELVGAVGKVERMAGLIKAGELSTEAKLELKSPAMQVAVQTVETWGSEGEKTAVRVVKGVAGWEQHGEEQAQVAAIEAAVATDPVKMWDEATNPELPADPSQIDSMLETTQSWLKEEAAQQDVWHRTNREMRQAFAGGGEKVTKAPAAELTEVVPGAPMTKVEEERRKVEEKVTQLAQSVREFEAKVEAETATVEERDALRQELLSREGQLLRKAASGKMAVLEDMLAINRFLTSNSMGAFDRVGWQAVKVEKSGATEGAVFEATLSEKEAKKAEKRTKKPQNEQKKGFFGLFGRKKEAKVPENEAE